MWIIMPILGCAFMLAAIALSFYTVRQARRYSDGANAAWISARDASLDAAAYSGAAAMSLQTSEQQVAEVAQARGEVLLMTKAIGVALNGDAYGASRMLGEMSVTTGDDDEDTDPMILAPQSGKVFRGRWGAS